MMGLGSQHMGWGKFGKNLEFWIQACGIPKYENPMFEKRELIYNLVLVN